LIPEPQPTRISTAIRARISGFYEVDLSLYIVLGGKLFLGNRYSQDVQNHCQFFKNQVKTVLNPNKTSKLHLLNLKIGKISIYNHHQTNLLKNNPKIIAKTPCLTG